MSPARTTPPGTVIWKPAIQAAIQHAVRGGSSPMNAVIDAVDRALKRPRMKPLAAGGVR